MSLRWHEILDIPFDVNEYGDALDLTNHVGPGIVSISGMFNGDLELWASVGDFRADDVGTRLFPLIEGSGLTDWYYREITVPRGYTQIRLKCTSNVNESDDDRIRALYTF